VKHVKKINLNDLNDEVLRKFFPNFWLKFKYVASLGPYSKDQEKKIFFLNRKWVFRCGRI
jgi:hypothetical protein